MTKWTRVSYGARENPGCYDTGNGALAYVDESAAYPGIERVTIRTYCGRAHDNRTYYRRADDARGAFVRNGAPTWDNVRDIPAAEQDRSR